MIKMKKALLIMPDFFNYPDVITNGLKKMGYTVEFINDRPSNNAFVKAFIRINRKFLSLYIKKYFDKVMKKISGTTFDLVLLISGQSLSFSESMIKKLRIKQKNAVFILYQWDSERNFPYIKKVQYYFDKCFTFEKNDSNKKVKFLPLFYSEYYKKIGSKKTNNVYDFCFIGTAHPKKYSFMKKMSKQLSKVYKKKFIYFYLPSKIVFYYRKLHDSAFRKANIQEFHFTPLIGSQFNKVYEKSKTVLDSPQDGQDGLTIRVIEALGARKKIITTNKDVMNYDFYSENNIYIYDGKFDYSSPFFKEEYKPVDNVIYQKYSIENWLNYMIKGEYKCS